MRLWQPTKAEGPGQQLYRALKAATRSRDRLTRLTPNIFSVDTDASHIFEENKAWWSEYVDVLYRLLDEKKGLPPQAASPVSKETPGTKKGPDIPDDEKGTPLESHAFQSLPTEKKAVIKDAYLAWRTWDRNVARLKQEFETRNPRWQDDDSPSSAQLRELLSRYNQALLGFSSKSGDGFLQSAKESTLPAKFDAKKFRAEELAKYGPPPEGVSEIEHLVRCGMAEDEKAKSQAATEQSPPVNSDGPLTTA